MQSKTLYLVLGDLLAIFVVTVIGFATHGEAGVTFLPRMAAAFLPVSLAWFVLAPMLGLFRPERVLDPKQLWRSVVAMLFAAPLAAVLRGLWLNAPIIPIFAVVLSSTSAFGMLVWRSIYWLINRGRS